MHQLILTKSGGSTSICGPRTWKSGGSTDPLDPVAPRTLISVASWQRGVRTQSIHRLWLCSKTVLPEYVSATGPRQKISIYVSVVHAHTLAAPCWIFNVCDVVVKQLLGLPRFQIILLITILIPFARLFSDYLGKTNSDNSVWWYARLIDDWLHCIDYHWRLVTLEIRNSV